MLPEVCCWSCCQKYFSIILMMAYNHKICQPTAMDNANVKSTASALEIVFTGHTHAYAFSTHNSIRRHQKNPKRLFSLCLIACFGCHFQSHTDNNPIGLCARVCACVCVVGYSSSWFMQCEAPGECCLLVGSFWEQTEKENEGSRRRRDEGGQMRELLHSDEHFSANCTLSGKKRNQRQGWNKQLSQEKSKERKGMKWLQRQRAVWKE